MKPPNARAGGSATLEKPGPRRSRESVGLTVLSLLSACEGLGPFAGAWLTANPTRRYNPAEIGTLNAIQQFLMTVMQPFVGKLVDWTRHKRTLLGMGSLAVGFSVAVTVFVPQLLWLQVAIQAPMAVGMMLVPLALNALTLGTMSPSDFTGQVALNNVAVHAGTVLSGAMMAAFALLLPAPSTEGDERVASPTWSIVPLLSSLLTVAALPMIRRSRIDYARAAGAEHESSRPTSSDDADVGCSASAVQILFGRGAFLRLLALAFTLNVANMAQLQLVVQHASQLDSSIAIPFTSAAQIIAHLVMTGSAVIAGRLADSVGRKPLLVVACFVVSVRALLTAATDIWWVDQGGTVWLTLLPCQVLDGVGAGLWGVLVVLLTRDVSAGTGCFNFAFGCVQALFAAGAIVSSEVSGQIAHAYGFGFAFIFLGLAGAVATMQALVLPETLNSAGSSKEIDTSSVGTESIGSDSV